MSVYLPKDSNIWWYEFRFNGRRIRESSKSRSKTIAIAAERAHRRRLEENYNDIKKPKTQLTFAAAAKNCIDACRLTLAARTMVTIEWDVKFLLPFIGKKLLSEITPQDIQGIVKARLDRGAANRYANMPIETLRRVLLFNGNEWDRLRKTYKKLKEPKRVGMALSHDEEKRLLHECRQTSSRVLYPAVILGLYAGMRGDEIRSLQWHQINIEKAFLTVGKSKTVHGENRTIPLIGPTLQAMRAWAARFPRRLPSHYVFPAERYASKIGKVYRHDPNEHIGSWRKAWEQARKRAKVRIRFHDLRHTAVTRLLEAGRTIEQIAPIMGWGAQTMYEMALIYAEWSLDAKRKTLSALEPRSKKRRRNPQKPSRGAQSN